MITKLKHNLLSFNVSHKLLLYRSLKRKKNAQKVERFNFMKASLMTITTLKNATECFLTTSLQPVVIFCFIEAFSRFSDV